MEWNNRSEVIGLAKANCTHCDGYGWRTKSVCNCVFREIFRVCFRRFKACARDVTTSAVRYELVSRAVNSPRVYGRKNEEFMADFQLIAKRTLTDPLEYKIFRFHFLLGAEGKLCARQLQMDEGRFHHAVYRVQQKLGKAFRETEPYGIYPVDEYFGGTNKGELAKALPVVLPRPLPVRPPLAVPASPLFT